MQRILSSLALALVLAACSAGGRVRDSGADTGSPPDGPFIHEDGTPDRLLLPDGPRADHPLPADGPTAQTVTIQQITSDQIPAGTRVLLASVTVTAVDLQGPYTGDVYVQDGTGAGSGLRLFTPQRADGGKISELLVGDSVRVEGEVKNWAPTAGFPDNKTIKEVVDGSLTRLGPGSALPATIVSVSSLLNPPTAKGWEHVLVQVKDVKVTQAPNSYGEFAVSGGLFVDDELYLHTPALGDCLSLTGISAYFYSYRLLPRGAQDVQPSSSCPGPLTLTIKDLQDTSSPNHPPVGSQVTVGGVITAVDANPSTSGTFGGFFIQDGTGPHSGIFVYHVWDANAALKPQTGQEVEVTGIYDEYYNLSELKNVSWTVKGTKALPAPAVVAAASVATGGAQAEAYEGVLVRVAGFTVDTILQDGGGKNVAMKDNTSKLVVDYELYDFFPQSVGTTYSTITGPLTFLFNEFRVLPRNATDLVQ